MSNDEAPYAAIWRGVSPPRIGGFSLVELMVVVAIISVLAMMAVPAFQRVRRRAKSTVIANDFRVFSQAFEQYAQETGSWPPNSGVGVFPPLMANRLNKTKFMRVTPMGGKYNWEYNQVHYGVRYTAAITISAATGAPLPLDVAQMTDLDRLIDDGDLMNGNFRVGTGQVPLWVITR